MLLKRTQLLTVMRDKLIKQLADPDNVDPLELLPLELIEMVLAHFSFKELQ